MDVSTSTTSTSMASDNPGLKRGKWACNKRKDKRNSGKAYKNIAGNDVSRKQFRKIEHCCRAQCFSNFNRDSQKEFFRNFYVSQDKEKQDTYLMSCAHREGVKRHKLAPVTKNRECSWKYSLKLHGKDINVCKELLISLYQISDGRMKTVLRFCKQGVSQATENRGKLPNPKKIPDEVWALVKDHWFLIPHKKRITKIIAI
ncbi:uncharacterized protein LOC126896448 [Daktulosphaira vitifoliae]|uniref:uncharacterized protein LOC126896448 n=1 Tax=Daktulosphaira vitifoliae TaxID=58002 RepID=UPI0021AAA0B8|nr:uncharacterized protein LOC126896448 [Daktulosphaira vitifoliae]